MHPINPQYLNTSKLINENMVKEIFNKIKNFFSMSNSDQKGQLNVFLAGPIVVVVGVIVVLLGIVMINGLASTATTSGQVAIGNQPAVQNMIAFVPFAGIGIVVGGILLTLLTVFGGLGARR
jgi:hypothetical protein